MTTPNTNLWSRRTNTGKLSLSVSNEDPRSSSDGPASASATRTFGGGPLSAKHRTRDPFNNGPASASAFSSLNSPNGASAAFGLGSGAFAAFSSNIKNPKTPGGGSSSANPLDSAAPPLPAKPSANAEPTSKEAASASSSSVTSSRPPAGPDSHPLRHSWVFWYRAPGTKFQDYEKSTQKIATVSTVESFWAVFLHLRRPSSLPHVSDYHLFRAGIRPVWEDASNRKGGKWMIRLKKGVSTRFWEDLVLAVVGDQFGDGSATGGWGDDLCGAVLSIRAQEDVLSIWTRNEESSCLKIREHAKRLCGFPADTVFAFVSHQEAMQTSNERQEASQQRAGKGVRTTSMSAVPTTVSEKPEGGS